MDDRPSCAATSVAPSRRHLACHGPHGSCAAAGDGKRRRDLCRDSNTVAAHGPRRPRTTADAARALIVVAVGLLACVVAAAAQHRQGRAAKPPTSNGCRPAPVPDSKPVAVPGGEQADAADRRRASAPPGPTSAATRSSGSPRVLTIDAGAPVGSGRILCAIKAPQRHRSRPDRRRPARHLPALQRRRDLRPGSAGNARWSTSARTAPNSPCSKSTTCRRRFTTEQGIKLEWPDVQDRRPSACDYFLPAGKPKQDLELPFDTVWKTTDSPGGQDRLHADHQRRRGDGRDRRRAAARLAADRRRSRRTEAKKKREEAEEDDEG